MGKYPELGLKRICTALAMSRSTYYLHKKPRPPALRGRPPTKETYNLLRGRRVSEEKVVREIEGILSEKFVLYGYRKVTAALRRRGYVINHKKVYRLMKERGLLLKELWKEKGQRKKGEAPEDVAAPDRKWSIDIKHGKALNGERGYVIAVKDCYTKEVISVAVEKKHTYQEVEKVMYQAFAERNFKELPLEELYVTSDNGSEIIKAMKSLKVMGIKHCRITPCSPWENGEIESFFSCLEREVFRRFEIEDFEKMRELVTEYVEFYNTKRIHGGIGYKTPRERYLEYVGSKQSEQEVLSNVG